jgi:hypothetical protein
MKKILSLMLGMSFVLGTLAFAQDSQTPPPDSSKSGKKAKKSKKSKGGDKMEAPKTEAPK